MTYTFKLDKEDFLVYQLFTVSESTHMKRKKRNSRILLTAGAIGIAWYFQSNGNIGMMYYFLFIGLLTGLFYPVYYRWRYKKHFNNFIENNYQNRFNNSSSISFENNEVIAQDSSGVGRVLFTEVEKLSEISSHFFMRLKSGDALIVPKGQLDNIYDFKNEFSKRGISIESMVDWKW